MTKSTKLLRKQLKKLPKLYMAEFNRCVGDNIKNVVRRLRAKDYEVTRLRHKTTVLIQRPKGVLFSEFCNDLNELVQPRIGSVIMSSTSGRFWLLDNKGNSPGIFQELTSADL